MTEIGDNGGPKFVYGGEGWIAMHRSVRDHWLVGFGKPVKPMDPKFGAHSRNEAFTDLIMECRYEAGFIVNGGRKMEIRPGQLVGAISWLASRWNWTPQTVRTFLDKLQDDQMIERKSPGADGENNKQKGNQSAIISVCNYERYQFVGDDAQQPKQQASNKPATSQQQASNNNTKDNKGTREQDNPPTPKGGEGAVSGVFDGIDREPPRAERASQDIAAAFEVYAKAADHFGLAKCSTLTEARRKRLAKRLADIGGVDAFTTALRALGATNDPFVKFVRGKVPPRPGESPFKLDIDRLMQTDGNLGDVLARLLDIGAAKATADTRKVQGPAWSQWTAEDWDRAIDAHANGIWPIVHLGPPPGSPGCACPREVVHRRRLTEIYNEHGIARGKH